MSEIDLEIDARGLLCPLPVLRLAKALRGLSANTVARLLATDPAAVEDIEVFCRERGHALEEWKQEGKIFSFRVRKGSGLAP